MLLKKYADTCLLFLSGFVFIVMISGFAKPNSYSKQELYQKIEMPDSLPKADVERIFEKVEVEASFPGGEQEWKIYLQNNLRPNVPIKKKAPAGAYTVIIQFVVDKKGNVSDIKPLTNHGYGMEKEVMRILKKSPKWVPAYQNGRPVNAYRKQPVTFSITQE